MHSLKMGGKKTLQDYPWLVQFWNTAGLFKKNGGGRGYHLLHTIKLTWRCPGEFWQTHTSVQPPPLSSYGLPSAETLTPGILKSKINLSHTLKVFWLLKQQRLHLEKENNTIQAILKVSVLGGGEAPAAAAPVTYGSLFPERKRGSELRRQAGATRKISLMPERRTPKHWIFLPSRAQSVWKTARARGKKMTYFQRLFL